MIPLKGMLIIGGNARNIGKSTLACQIIRTFSPQTAIIGLKVITHRKGDEQYHGVKDTVLEENFRITEEYNYDIPKDTARMLNAGASKVYMIRAREAYLLQAVNEFMKIVDKDSIFVCESSSLSHIVKAGVYIMIRSGKAIPEKESALITMKLADRVIETGGDPEEIKNIKLDLILDQGQWKINKV